MRYAIPPRVLLVGTFLVIAACASGQHPVVMEVEGSRQVFRGTMNVGANIQDVQVQNADESITCDGVSLLGYAGLSCTSNGSFRLECSDGRTVNADWRMFDCNAGTGSGRDSRGNTVTFRIGDSVVAQRSPELPRPVPQDRVVATPPPAPVQAFLFRFGGELAAGFPRESADALLEDSETGLVIANAGGSSKPMSLSRQTPRAGQEAFLVLPDTARIISVQLRDGEEGWLQLRTADIPGTGLPLLNFEGEVIGLTFIRNGSMHLFDANRLRRYLGVLVPELAAEDAVAGSADSVRKRIMDPRTR